MLTIYLSIYLFNRDVVTFVKVLQEACDFLLLFLLLLLRTLVAFLPFFLLLHERIL